MKVKRLRGLRLGLILIISSLVKWAVLKTGTVELTAMLILDVSFVFAFLLLRLSRRRKKRLTQHDKLILQHGG